MEKEDRVAVHQSGHNSGVVHAGVYYPPGSLKATLCRRGAAMTREFCQQHEVRLRELGKLIVAASEQELTGLAQIEDRATRNQVPGIRRVPREEIADIEPCIQGAAALYSPHTAAVDYVGMCQALSTDIGAAGGKVLLGTAVTAVRETRRHGGPGSLRRVSVYGVRFGSSCAPGCNRRSVRRRPRLVY